MSASAAGEWAASMWGAWLAGTVTTLPGVLGDIWRDGHRTAVDRYAPLLDAAERDADHWYYIARNPQAERDETRHTIALMATAAGRARDTWRRGALDRLEASTPTTYHGVIALMMDGRTWEADRVLQTLTRDAAA